MIYRAAFYSFMRSRLELAILLVFLATASQAPAQIIGLGIETDGTHSQEVTRPVFPTTEPL